MDDGARRCIFCGEEIHYDPQHGGWNSARTQLELDDCWCPEADPLLILGRSTSTGHLKHQPAK